MRAKYLPVLSLIVLLSAANNSTPKQKISPTAPDTPRASGAAPAVSPEIPAGMVLIPAGEFMMGCNEPIEEYCNTPNKPYHKVYLDAYYIDKFEATVKQFQECVKAGKCSNYSPDETQNAQAMGCNWVESGRENHPVNCVDWNQADSYCKWAGKRLPTEAEWEKAARGTDGRKFPWGNQDPTCDDTVFDGDVYKKLECGNQSTMPVGSKPAGASPYGAMDMAGNVSEWVADLYGKNYYASSPERNPPGPAWGTSRVVRGGGWGAGEEPLRTSYRSQSSTLRNSSDDTGFRCAMGTNPPQNPPPAAQPQHPVEQAHPGEMVTVPAGEFTMGSTEDQVRAATEFCDKNGEDRCSDQAFYETPQNRVYLDEFQIDKYEVTVGQFLACVNADKCSEPVSSNTCNWGRDWPDNDKYPMSCVSWDQADEFCKWDGKMLPTEAQWEKAARGTDGRTYPWGNEMATCNYAVMEDNGDYGCARETRIWPVGSKPMGASPYGAMDMAGNLAEWVGDWFQEDYYANTPKRNPAGPKSGEKRVYRGGDWGETPSFLRVTIRGMAEHDHEYSTIGFRCARGKNRPQTPQPPAQPTPPVKKAQPGEMTLVPAGQFMMGCNEALLPICRRDEQPYHKVYLDAFYIDIFQVTVEQYGACLKAGKCPEPIKGGACNWDVPDRENHPMNCIHWDQADKFCKWAGKRLPTEAEWEKAAGGTDGRMFPWGNHDPTCSFAVMNDGGRGCGKDSTWPVGSKPKGASPYGAMDMAGNVREWVADWYDENYYKNSPNRNPKGPASGILRVMRGDSWEDRYPENFLVWARGNNHPDSGVYDLGFRCAKTQ